MKLGMFEKERHGASVQDRREYIKRNGKTNKDRNIKGQHKETERTEEGTNKIGRESEFR